MTDFEDPARIPTPGQRAAAVLALATGAVTIVFLVTQAFRRWDVLLATIVSMAVLVAAAWIVLSRRGAKRAIAAAVAIVALVVFVIVMVASESIPILVIALVLAIVTVAAAGKALSDQLEPASEPRRAPRANHPVLIMNLKSGGGKAERFDLDQRCRERGIEPVVLTPGSDLLQLAEDAVARGADVLGMAGGDGSQALVASVASRHGLPFVVIPAGTRNHFALDLGIDREDVVGALDAFSDGVVRVVDLAEVNGRVFVNNASMGVYAKIVQSDDYRDAKVQTTAAMLPDLLHPDAAALDLRFDLPSGNGGHDGATGPCLQQPVPTRWTTWRLQPDADGHRAARGRLAHRQRTYGRPEAHRTAGNRTGQSILRLGRVEDVAVRGQVVRPHRHRRRR